MSRIEPGDVRLSTWDDRPFRVLAADAVEVLLDVWLPHLNAGRGGWHRAKLGMTASYYRVPTALMRRESRHLRREALSDEEQAVHRPDLPLRLLRKTGWSWSPERFSSRKAFSAAAAQHGVDVKALGRDRVLKAAAVVIFPLGPKGGRKRGVTLLADDGEAFTGMELLYKAHVIQAKLLHQRGTGAGIYRLGCANRLPSFYLAGDRDLAGFLEHE